MHIFSLFCNFFYLEAAQQFLLCDGYNFLHRFYCLLNSLTLLFACFLIISTVNKLAPLRLLLPPVHHCLYNGI